MSIEEIIQYRNEQKAKNEEIEKILLLQHKYNRLARQAEEEVEKKLFVERHRLKLQLGLISTPIIKDLMEEVKTLREQAYKQSDGNDNKFPCYWITISPPPTCPFVTFKKVVEKAFSKKWIDSYIYVYEQRGITPDEIGMKPHIHALLWKTNKRFSHMLREFKSTFSCIIDMEHEYLDNFFQFTGCSENDIPKRIKYMLGTKESTEQNHKDLKQKYDIPFREQNGLLPYYHLNAKDLIKEYKDLNS